jgi:hypothetical protein
MILTPAGSLGSLDTDFIVYLQPYNVKAIFMNLIVNLYNERDKTVQNEILKMLVNSSFSRGANFIKQFLSVIYNFCTKLECLLD